MSYKKSATLNQESCIHPHTIFDMFGDKKQDSK